MDFNFKAVAEGSKMFGIYERVGTKSVLRGTVSVDGVNNGKFDILGTAKGYTIAELLSMKMGDKTPMLPCFHEEKVTRKINPITGRVSTSSTDEFVNMSQVMGTLADLNNLALHDTSERKGFFKLVYCGKNDAFFQFEKVEFNSNMYVEEIKPKEKKESSYTFKFTDAQLKFLEGMGIDLHGVELSKVFNALKKVSM